MIKIKKEKSLMEGKLEAQKALLFFIFFGNSETASVNALKYAFKILEWGIVKRKKDVALFILNEK